MKKEIERKFLVDVSLLPPDLVWQPIRQGYLAFEPQVRVRTGDGRNKITIKTRGMLTRDEWEYKIPEADAQELVTLCEYVIEKDRATVEFAGKTWEIDRFHGRHEGLVTAEIELISEDERIELPAWVRTEVTNDEQYLNINLVRSK